MVMLTKVCFYCKQEFQAAHALANICSPGCRKRTSRTTAPEAPPGRPGTGVEPDQGGPPLAESDQEPRRIAAGCRRCGVAIEAPTGTRKYCSSACRRAMRQEDRKAMIRRAYVEPVSLAVLRRRDEDRCRICGEPVDSTAQPPHPSAATIDHVVALARGGEHSYRNTQLAHLRCNLAKGAG
jgi:5-methylcytosine-specific restriction endonuclease McrA